MNEQQAGACAACGRPGPVGEVCANPGCAALTPPRLYRAREARGPAIGVDADTRAPRGPEDSSRDDAFAQPQDTQKLPRGVGRRRRAVLDPFTVAPRAPAEDDLEDDIEAARTVIVPMPTRAEASQAEASQAEGSQAEGSQAEGSQAEASRAQAPAVAAPPAATAAEPAPAWATRPLPDGLEAALVAAAPPARGQAPAPAVDLPPPVQPLALAPPVDLPPPVRPPWEASARGFDAPALADDWESGATVVSEDPSARASEVDDAFGAFFSAPEAGPRGASLKAGGGFDVEVPRPPRPRPPAAQPDAPSGGWQSPGPGFDDVEESDIDKTLVSARPSAASAPGNPHRVAEVARGPSPPPTASEDDDDDDEGALQTRTGHEMQQWVPGFRLLRPLGEGASSQVFLAVPEGSELQVAVKILKTTLDADRDRKALRTFIQEVKALSQLTHPNVIAYHGCGQDQIGRPYLVMEVIDGGHDLEQELVAAFEARRGLELSRVRHILEQVLAALEAAQVHSMVHRDIKPGNIMIQEQPGEGPTVKVLDFGLAKFTDEGDGTKTRHFAGTPMYAAPEQGLGESIRGWTDLYAVAQIALEMVTGQAPFAGLDKREVIKAKMGKAQALEHRIRQTAEGLNFPPEVIGFFVRALAAKPDERHGALSEFRIALWACLDTLEAGTPEGSYGQGCAPYERPAPSITASPMKLAGLAAAALLIVGLSAWGFTALLASRTQGDVPGPAAVQPAGGGGPVEQSAPGAAEAARVEQAAPYAMGAGSVEQVAPPPVQSPPAAPVSAQPSVAATEGAAGPGPEFLLWTAPSGAAQIEALLQPGWFSLPMYHGPDEGRFADGAPAGLDYVANKSGVYDVHKRSLGACVMLRSSGAWVELECALKKAPAGWPAGPWGVRGWTKRKALNPSKLP